MLLLDDLLCNFSVTTPHIMAVFAKLQLFLKLLDCGGFVTSITCQDCIVSSQIVVDAGAA